MPGRHVFVTCSLLVAFVWGDLASTANACPMCKEANEAAEDEVAAARPAAYMYSILFMLSMPVVIFSGFGIAFYRMTRRAKADPARRLDPVDDPNRRPTGVAPSATAPLAR